LDKVDLDHIPSVGLHVVLTGRADVRSTILKSIDKDCPASGKVTTDLSGTKRSGKSVLFVGEESNTACEMFLPKT
jgi:hypothetical protein